MTTKSRTTGTLVETSKGSYVQAGTATVTADPTTSERSSSYGHVVTSRTRGEVRVRLIPKPDSGHPVNTGSSA